MSRSGEASREVGWQDAPVGGLAFPSLDRVCIGEVARGMKYVSGGEIYSEGHFPSLRILPGVVLIDAVMTLAAGLCGRPELALRVLRIRQFRFSKPVQPGDLLEIEVERGEEAGSFAASAFVDGALVAHGVVELEC